LRRGEPGSLTDEHGYYVKGKW